LNFFFALIALLIGSFALRVLWVRPPRRIRRHLLLSLTTSTFLLVSLLILGGRLGIGLGALGVISSQLPKLLPFSGEVAWLLVLLPVFLFLQIWGPVLRVYRFSGWYLSLPASLLLIAWGLASIVPEPYLPNPRGYVEEPRLHLRETHAQYTEQQFGVVLPDSFYSRATVAYSPAMEKGLFPIWDAFYPIRPLPLDTLLMADYLLRQGRMRHAWNWRDSWPYQSPWLLYFQLHAHPPDEPEVQVLVNTLTTMAYTLLDYHETPVPDTVLFVRGELRRYYGAQDLSSSWIEVLSVNGRMRHDPHLVRYRDCMIPESDFEALKTKMPQMLSVNHPFIDENVDLARAFW
ncbi:MAG: hypothetical protein AAFQ98_24755, partial [Bacteroidota bacterium]